MALRQTEGIARVSNRLPWLGECKSFSTDALQDRRVEAHVGGQSLHFGVLILQLLRPRGLRHAHQSKTRLRQGAGDQVFPATLLLFHANLPLSRGRIV